MYVAELQIIEPTKALADNTAQWLQSILPPFKGDATMHLIVREVVAGEAPVDSDLLRAYTLGQDTILSALAGRALGIN